MEVAHRVRVEVLPQVTQIAAAWKQRVSRGRARLTLPLIEQGLWSETFRGVVVRQLETLILAQIKESSGTRLPARVVEDELDAARALLRSVERALSRKQFARNVLHGMLKALLANSVAALQDTEMRTAAERFAERHQGRPSPLFLVISPTSACNLRCAGCYASAGTTQASLEWEILERIVAEAKSLWGVRFFVISGGEPLAYRSQGHDVLEMAGHHPDCFFLMFTNGTLINEGVAGRIAEAANLTPAISVEGLEARTDERRGPGVFQRILAAMDCLRRAGVPFGVSLTATRRNAEELLSDAFIKFFFDEQQAVYGWLFQYMPIGRGYSLDLLPTAEQRVWMWRRTWQLIREQQIMLADFWNCGTASQGCIAAGQDGGYFYIDWNGRVMPCVFVPYSPVKVHEIYARGGTLDDVYEMPYFGAIRRWQWKYGLGKERPEKHGNWLLPCSLRDHYAVGRALIKAFHPEPEDEAAAEALRDPSYYRRMVAYDIELRKLFDPIWQKEYLGEDSA